MKQLKKEDWLILFNNYEKALKNNDLENFWNFYFALKHVGSKEGAKYRFIQKYDAFIAGKTNLVSQTGKTPKKGKGSGRPRKKIN
ncbi:hypothetical protein ACW95P_01590 [Candidatus Mycoplasma pogonae]